MKILMIYPQIDAPLGTNHGIASLAGVLHDQGHEMDLMHVSEKYRPVPSSEEIIDHIRETGPGLVGFSVMSQQYEWVVEKSKAIREALPELVQVIGGVHCTMVPDEVHKSRLFDYVCVGEGDWALPELMDELEKGERPHHLSNYRSWMGNVPVANPVAPFPDLEQLPPLDYNVFDMNAVMKETRGWMGILTSRGCPYKCTYCFNIEIVDQYIQDGAARNVKDFLRHFPVGVMMEDLKKLKRENPEINTFIFDDDLFTLNTDYVIEFCEAYKKHKVNTPFVVNGHVNCFDEPAARALKEAGCIIVKFGLESGSPRVRREVLKRYMKNAQIEHSFASAHAYDLHSSAFIMFGLPYESREEIMETIRLCAKVKMGRFRWALFFPFKGTAGYEIAKPLIDESKIAGQGNYFDGSCLKFGAEHDLFLDKLSKLCNWYVNAETDWECAPIYRGLVDKVEAMNRDAWLREYEDLVAYDRDLSEQLMIQDKIHYTIRYSNVMGVRSDYIKQEREQVATGEKKEAVAYTLDQS
jgi:radical SAM superfamily enzyme YgiQ (UPF0313 family)